MQGSVVALPPRAMVGARRGRPRCGSRLARCGFIGLLCAAAACAGERGQGAGAGAAAAAAVAPTADAIEARLLRGGGTVCTQDGDCGIAPAQGACVLGTCFGLLTTDNPAAIATLLTRLRRLDLGGVAHVEELCGRLLWEPSAMPMQRYAAAAALSSIARQRPLGGCGQACEALTPALADRDGALAAEARTGLWRHDRSGAALAALLDDLRHGSEHARVAAARALATPLRSTQTAGDTLPPAAVAALTDCLDDASPALRSAAAHALATGAPIAAAAALTRARARRPWELGYALDRDGPGQEP